jgi:hypothetical protein
MACNIPKGIQLKRTVTESNYSNRCVICQTEDAQLSATGSEKGRKRVREAAEIRQDKVLELIHDFGEDQFVYHMSNDCYKAYTHKQHLERIKRQKLEYETIHQQPSSSQDELQSHSTRSKVSARDKPSQDVDANNLKGQQNFCQRSNFTKTKYTFAHLISWIL